MAKPIPKPSAGDKTSRAGTSVTVATSRSQSGFMGLLPKALDPCFLNKAKINQTLEAIDAIKNTVVKESLLILRNRVKKKRETLSVSSLCQK
jgi:hypothetical protein